jgi:MFS family permease
MALALDRSGIQPGYFFFSCLTVLITSRIFLVGYLARFAREAIVTIGILTMVGAYACFAELALTAVRTAILGGLLGLGYSMTFPLLSVWISDQFAPDERGRPVALFGAAFHVGIYTVPFAMGVMGTYISVYLALLWIAGFSAALTLVALAFFHTVSSNPAGEIALRPNRAD